jgi:DNA topoisomerase-1
MKRTQLKIKRIAINPRSKKKRFIYLDEKNNQIKDQSILYRIGKLVIPPAYTDIKIADTANNYLQAVGIDEKGRKQYIYNKSFVASQSRNKYCQLKNFGTHINQIRKDVRSIMMNDMPVNDKEKMIALIIYILDNCHFRIGNIHYFNEYQSHGVSTLQTKHLTFSPSEVKIEFIGKKGVLNTCLFTDALSIKLLKELVSISNKNNHPHNFLFYYKDNDNDKDNDKDKDKDNDSNIDKEKEKDTELQILKPIDINNFLNKYHEDITLKMFRTWSANCIFIEEIIKNKKLFIEVANSNTTKEIIQRKTEKLINEILKIIAIKLHNTPSVSKKSYLDDNLVQIYLKNPKSFWKKANKNKNDITLLLLDFFNKNCNVGNNRTHKANS